MSNLIDLKLAVCMICLLRLGSCLHVSPGVYVHSQLNYIIFSSTFASSRAQLSSRILFASPQIRRRQCVFRGTPEAPLAVHSHNYQAKTLIFVPLWLWCPQIESTREPAADG